MIITIITIAIWSEYHHHCVYTKACIMKSKYLRRQDTLAVIRRVVHAAVGRTPIRLHDTFRYADKYTDVFSSDLLP